MAETEDSRPPLWTGHVSLYTADIAVAARFYEQIGMRPVTVMEEFAALEMRGGTHLVMFYDPDKIASGPVAWDLMVEDIDATHHKWQADGLSVTDIVLESPHRVFDVTDSDGHVVRVRDTHVVGFV